MTNKILLLSLVILIIPLFSFFAKEKTSVEYAEKLPPMETFIMEPLEIENASIWVPAAKIGPLINRSCKTKEQSCSSLLPATVNHSKKECCPDEVARILAEQVAYYHEKSLPLTIFNGWQWEYLYSLSQFGSELYIIEDHGGCWENSWEAILTSSIGSLHAQWISISSSDAVLKTSENHVSNIKINTFNDMRTRDEYPKVRKID